MRAVGCHTWQQGWELASKVGHTQGTCRSRQRQPPQPEAETPVPKKQLSLGRDFRKQNTTHTPSHGHLMLPAATHQELHLTPRLWLYAVLGQEVIAAPVKTVPNNGLGKSAPVWGRRTQTL